MQKQYIWTQCKFKIKKKKGGEGKKTIAGPCINLALIQCVYFHQYTPSSFKIPKIIYKIITMLFIILMKLQDTDICKANVADVKRTFKKKKKIIYTLLL